MPRRKLTPAQVAQFEQDHLNRLDIINKPFPPIRRVVYYGSIWAGALITHDDDALFLKGQKAHFDGAYGDED